MSPQLLLEVQDPLLILLPVLLILILLPLT